MSKKLQVAPQNKETDYSKYEGRDQWWTTDPKGESFLLTAETGLGSANKGGVPQKTLVDLLLLASQKNGNRVALRTENLPPLKQGENPPSPLPLKQWKTWTYQQYYDDTRKVAKAFVSLGLEAFQSVSIFGFNSPQWAMAMFGAIMAGGKGTGLYPSDTAEQAKYKANHSDAVIAVVEDQAAFDKFKQICEDLPLLKAIITWGCEAGEDIATKDGRTVKTMNFEELLDFGAKQEDAELDERIKNIKPSHCAVLVYTSGTTGHPKAVMVSHDSLHFAASAALSCCPDVGVTKGEERAVSYLPLSHVAGFMVDLIVPLCISANIIYSGWMSTNFARSYDMKRGTLMATVGAVKPTFFIGVPRVWEKIMEKLKAAGAATTGIKKHMSSFAKKKAAVYTSSRQLGEKPKNPSNMFAANYVLNKIKKKLGFDQAKFLFTGAAPLSIEVLDFFGALGISIYEVYGMSETCGVGVWSNRFGSVRGSAGFEVTACEVKVFQKGTNVECPAAKELFKPTDEEQGEICFRGRNIMMGYMANPRLGDEHVEHVEMKNKEAFDSNGWLLSGDKGCRDVRGMFKITGRFKELIITAGGENISPIPIEDELKKVLPLVSNAVMIGNERKFNVLVVTLKAEGASGELPGSNKLTGPAAAISDAKTIEEAMENEAVIKAISDGLKQVNANEDVVVSNAAKIQKFTILPRDFSVVTGEFTPTLKLKRQTVDDMFKPILDKMYESTEEYVRYTLAPTPDLPMGPATSTKEESAPPKAEAAETKEAEEQV